MTRESAVKLLQDELNKAKLSKWHIRVTQDINKPFLGLCDYKNECIILNAQHIDTHPDPEIVNTIKHEVAHAIVGPGHGHDSVWADKARELGCTNTMACSSLGWSPEVLDAIRSGADVKIDFIEETHVTYRPKYEITRLQDKCEKCGKVAKEKSTKFLENKDPEKPDSKIIFLECGHFRIKTIPKGTPFGSLISNSWRNGKCEHEWEVNRCKNCGESKLFPFQIKGAEFLEQALASQQGGAIFDEMGLGKTVQALAYIKYHKEQGPFLFLVKAGIKYQWLKEILKWCGKDYIPQVIESGKDYIIPGLTCYIASYDIFTVRKSKSGSVTGMPITNFDFIKTIVMDECQQIKNPDAARTQAVRKICKGRKVIALSGTPWKNRGSEFFTVLNMMSPLKFPSYQNFLDRWVDYYYDGQYMKQAGIQRVEQFKEYIKEIAIRREVFEVAVEMPDVRRQMHYTQLEGVENKTYDDAESDFVKWFNEQVIGGDENNLGDVNILAQMARMRHITGLAKIPATEEFVEEFFEETDRKLVIFVHHKDVGDILYRSLKAKYGNQIPVYKLTAELNPAERFETAENFQSAKRAFMVASTLASGEGINLQTCADALLHERQWNPQNEDQAAPGRFRRIGSTHSLVNVTFMTAAQTIDEILGDIVEKKRSFFHNAMNKGETVTIQGKSLAMELAEGLVQNQKNKLQKMATPVRKRA